MVKNLAGRHSSASPMEVAELLMDNGFLTKFLRSRNLQVFKTSDLQLELGKSGLVLSVAVQLVARRWQSLLVSKTKTFLADSDWR